jgi:hypothetical protein
MKKLLKNEDGQVLVLFALMLVVLFGFASLVIDVGSAKSTQAKLQNTADAAALAGAQDLPNASAAENTAVTYAGLNGMKATENGVKQSGDTVIATTNGDSTKIEVVCTRNVPNTFARVLGFKDTDVSARAVAQNSKWAGDALPFINLDGDGEGSTIGQPLSAWNKVGPGDKERISNTDLVVNTNSIKVKYEDGFITFKKGKVMSDVKDPLKNIVVVGNIVYIISLKQAEMPNYLKGGPKELKNGDLIPVEDTVLLKCEVTDGWAGTGSDLIDLKFLDSYAWDASNNTYISATGDDPGGSVGLSE